MLTSCCMMTSCCQCVCRARDLVLTVQTLGLITFRKGICRSCTASPGAHTLARTHLAARYTFVNRILSDQIDQSLFHRVALSTYRSVRRCQPTQSQTLSDLPRLCLVSRSCWVLEARKTKVRAQADSRQALCQQSTAAVFPLQPRRPVISYQRLSPSAMRLRKM